MATLSLTGHEFGHLCMSERLKDRRELFRYALAIIGSGLAEVRKLESSKVRELVTRNAQRPTPKS